MNQIENVQTASGEAELATSNQPTTLSGGLGTLDIVFTVLAYNAPLTVVVGLIPIIISMGNGLGAPLTYLAAGALMLLFGVGFTTMSKHVKNAGAYYAYITLGLGKPLGLGSALMAILAYLFMILGSYLYAGVIYDSLAKSVTGHSVLEWWQYSLILLVIVSILGYFRITLSAKLMTIALVCEVLLVFAWEAAITYINGAGSLSPTWFTPTSVTSGSIGLAVLFGVTCFAGFEATAVFREEARNPEVTVPRATYASIIVMALLFASAAYFFISGFGPSLALSKASGDPSTAALESIGRFLGHAGLEAVNVLMCSSIFACLLAIHNILARYVYSLSIDGTFPRQWSAVHKHHGSPYKASVLVSVVLLIALVAVILVKIEPYVGYAALVGVAGYALLLLQILTSASVINFFRSTEHNAGVWRTLIAPLMSLTGLCATAWLATINIGLLTGNERVAAALLACIFGTLIGGGAYAVLLKTRRPEVYRAIGRQVV